MSFGGMCPVAFRAPRDNDHVVLLGALCLGELKCSVTWADLTSAFSPLGSVIHGVLGLQSQALREVQGI